ncbi:glycerophosphodiester phosphodiesterase [Planctomicrobium sp. SH668]|uniref:glycerophosphodiester phosphodiesterase n=1 Tax=Planctomicrobium sp. SH668 TaxID=3448126 RepID=UPI003F5BE195
MPRHPITIAHRGASGYLPEHTLEAKAMAHAMGADFLEQDVVLTQDDIPIVLHDIHLDTVSDVATKFPGRARADGRFYAIDFSLAEVRQLTASERFDHQTGVAVFPKRFPAHVGRFTIPTLEEELNFIRGMNTSTGREAGIYPEIKQPAFHHAEGKDITSVVLQVLTRHGYTERDSTCYVQCFDGNELRRLRNELGTRLKLIKLMEAEECLAASLTDSTLASTFKTIAKYADGIGPSISGIFQRGEQNKFVHTAHTAGLVVHPWTCRADAPQAEFSSFEDLHQRLMQAGIDGLFTDFPDRSQALLRSLAGEA